MNCFAHLFNTWKTPDILITDILWFLLEVPGWAQPLWGTEDPWVPLQELVAPLGCQKVELGFWGQKFLLCPYPKVMLCPWDRAWLLKSLSGQFSPALKMFSWFSASQPSRGRGACWCLWNTSHSATPQYNNLSSAWHLKAFFFRSPRQEL